MVVKVCIAMKRGFESLGRFEVMGLQHFGNPAIEAFNHSVGLGVGWRYQAMLDALLGLGAIENVVPGGSLFTTQAAIGEHRAVVGQALLKANRRGLNQGFQKGFGGLGGAVLLQGD